MSFFPVTNATVAPAPAPTGPPISAPVPPPARAPITAPQRLRHRSTPSCVSCGPGRFLGWRRYGHRSSARSRSRLQRKLQPRPAYQPSGLPRVHYQPLSVGALRDHYLAGSPPPDRRPLHQSGLPVCSGLSQALVQSHTNCRAFWQHHGVCAIPERGADSVSAAPARVRPDHKVVPFVRIISTSHHFGRTASALRCPCNKLKNKVDSVFPARVQWQILQTREVLEYCKY